MNQQNLENKLQTELETLVSKQGDIFSALLGISKPANNFYWSGAAGFAYADQPDVTTPNTPFFIASITKMYTASATMILEERGKLKLSDPLSKHLPGTFISGLHRLRGKDYSDQLNVYHLLSQTSGLPDYFTGKPRGGQSVFDRLITEGDFAWNLEKVLEITKHSLSPKFPPEPEKEIITGNKAFYSDTNYQLLGAILESVTGKPLQEVFSELILEPLNLVATYLHGFEQSMPTDASPATIYYKTEPISLDLAMKSFGPDGGMVSTVKESLRFLRELLDGSLFADPTTLERMKNWKKIFFPMNYGMGLMRIKLPRIFSPFSPSPELVGHSGATSAFLFQSDRGGLLTAGTLNQIDNQARPVRLMFRLIDLVNKELT
jgi:CubicO group peptidase (beta-lactamase class C family)